MAMTGREQELVARYIEVEPGRGRAYAYLKDSGVSVSTLVREWRRCGRDVARVAQAYDVSEESVAAAIAFYERYRRFIDARILLEDDAFGAVSDVA